MFIKVILSIFLILGLFFSKGLYSQLIKAKEKNSLAEKAFNQQNYLSALRYYRQALKLNPYDAKAMKGMGKSFYKLKNYKRSLDFFKKSESQFDNDPMIKVWIAKIKMNQKYFKEAELYLIKALKIKPRHYDAHITYGDLYSKKRFYSKSLELYLKACNIKSHNSLAYLKLGELFLKLKQPKKALEYLEKAQDLDNQNPLSYYYLGKYYFHQRDYISSQKYLKNALWLSPNYKEAMNILYQSVFQLEQFEKARELLERLSNESPNNTNYAYHLGLVLEKLGLIDESLDLLIRFLDDNLEDEALRFLAEKIFHKYYWTSEAVRERGSKLAHFWFRNGKNYLRQNLKNKAIFCFKRAIRLDPNYWQSRLELANIYRRDGFLNLYYNELKIVNIINPQNQEVKDNIRFVKRIMRRFLSNSEGIEQYNEIKNKPKIALLELDKNDDFENHHSVEKIFRKALFTALRMKNRLNIFLVEPQKDQESEERMARLKEADFIIRGFVKEEGDIIHVTLRIINLTYGVPYKSIKIIQKGNERFLTSALYLAEQVNLSFPVLGQIIRKNNKQVILNIGKIQDFKLGDKFYVIRSSKVVKKLLSLKNLDEVFTDKKKLNDILKSFNKDKRFGVEEIKIIEIDENISKGKIITSDFFNEINLHAYVIKKP